KGYRLLRRDGKPKRWLDKLLVNSLQSLVFNSWLAERMNRGLFDTVIHGDIAMKHETGGKFLVGDAAAEAPRAKAFEISATGPLFGKKYHEAQFEAKQIEDEVLEGFELGRPDFKALPGARRPIRFPLTDWAVEETPDGLWVRFFLPAGAYATAVLREVMKLTPEDVE
ncbi:MAG: tRNA pseudouridine(13) synthase TruD, partial [Candidatus Sericytochromatia bacterium]